MATLFLILVVVLVLAALVFGVITLLSGDDPGMVPVEADGRARPLPNNRSLSERDLKEVRFDLSLRGYRMSQVDKVLRRTAYDLGYKDEMIAVLEAEVIALRDGRMEDAELLRKARESAANPAPLIAAPPTATEASAEDADDAPDLDDDDVNEPVGDAPVGDAEDAKDPEASVSEPSAASEEAVTEADEAADEGADEKNPRDPRDGADTAAANGKGSGDPAKRAHA
jgi:DivIVA domain-containing protein